MVRHDESHARITKLLEVGGLQNFRGFEFEIDDLEACLSRFDEDVELGRGRAVELSSMRLKPAGRDRGDRSVFREELLEFWKGSSGFVQVIEAKLKEGGLLDCGGGALEHVVCGRAGDGYADFCDAGTEMLCGKARQCDFSMIQARMLHTGRLGCKHDP